jgi:diaminopimelate decarboxylase
MTGTVHLPQQDVPEAVQDRISQVAQDERPAWVVDLAGFRDRCESAGTAAAEAGVSLLMAVKACSDPDLLSVAASAGIGFDCSNLTELRAVEPYLRPETAISLTVPAVPSYERTDLLTFLSQRANTWANWNSLEQLRWACREAPGAAHGLRLFSPEVAPAELAGSHRQSRFGFRLDQVSHALSEAEGLGARLTSLHVHNGTSEHEAAWYSAAVATMTDCAQRTGLPLERINVGGGLRSKTGSELGELLDVAERSRPDGVRFVAEPGGWWTRGLVWLVSPVLDVVPGELCDFVVLDAGSENHRRWSLPTAPAFGATASGTPHVLCGRTCSEKDYFAQVPPGPPGTPVPRTGDWIALGMSSYSMELQSSFGGLRPLPRVLVG